MDLKNIELNIENNRIQAPKHTGVLIKIKLIPKDILERRKKREIIYRSKGILCLWTPKIHGQKHLPIEKCYISRY